MSSLSLNYCGGHGQNEDRGWYLRCKRETYRPWSSHGPAVKPTRAVVRLSKWQQAPIEGRPQIELESPEMRWLTNHGRRLDAYLGQWLLIQGDMLIAHSPSFGVIRGAISEHSIHSPFVYYMPTEEESNFFGV